MEIKVVKTSDYRSNLLTAFYRNFTKLIIALLIWEVVPTFWYTVLIRAGNPSGDARHAWMMYGSGHKHFSL
jgi:hypothetical protein